MAEQIDNEEWRDIPGFVGYQASSLGRVRSRKRILKTPKLDKNGYLSYCLRLGASSSQPLKKNFLAHRLVGLAFIPNPENKPFINHKNGIKGVCRPSNLEWCTKPENGRHAVLMGLHTPLRAEANGNSVLTEPQVKDIRSKYATGCYSHKALATEYGIGRSTVAYIVQGKLWGHLETGIPSLGFNAAHTAMKAKALSMALKGREGKKGDFHPRSILNTESVIAIRKKFQPYVYTIAMLADEHGVSRATVKAVLQRRLWSHV